MTDIYIVRHAEAEGNYYRRAHGHYNSNLTEFGYRQLPYLRKRFDGVCLDAVYSSDLKRAVETARAVAEPREMKIRIDPELRETCVGIWEDEPWGNLSHREPEMMHRYNNDPMRWAVSGGEPAEDTQKRMLSAVERIAKAHPDQAVALFTHGGAIRLLMAALRKTPSEEIRWTAKGDNTGVTLLRVDGDCIEIVYEGDNSHLPVELSGIAKQKWWLEEGEKTISPRMDVWDPESQRELYERLYADAWCSAHGEAEFDPAPYYRRALEKHRIDPTLIMIALDGDEPMGLIEFDDQADKAVNAGHISFYAMTEKYRGRKQSPIMMGEAISRYRRLGREKLRLCAAPENKRAEGYYLHLGFRKVGLTEGAISALNVMEKDIRV